MKTVGKHESSRRTMKLTGVLIAMLFFVLSSAVAQYYERSFERNDDRMIYGGFLLTEFTPRSSNAYPDSLSITMKKIVPIIGFRQGLVDVSIGYNTFGLRGQSKGVLIATAAVATEVPVLFSRAHAFIIPIMISSDYTKLENTGGNRENFNIGSVGLGAGVKYRYRSPQFEFALSAAEAAHWSLEGFSTGSGFSAATIAEALFTFREVFSLDGIALGYRMRFQTWNMSNAKFNYDSFSHGAILGVLF